MMSRDPFWWAIVGFGALAWLIGSYFVIQHFARIGGSP
jgi:hypothetical protein